MNRRRAMAAGVAEKKIAILEAALRHHPGSDALLLALLQTAQVLLEPDDLEVPLPAVPPVPGSPRCKASAFNI